MCIFGAYLEGFQEFPAAYLPIDTDFDHIFSGGFGPFPTVLGAPGGHVESPGGVIWWHLRLTLG